MTRKGRYAHMRDALPQSVVECLDDDGCRQLTGDRAVRLLLESPNGKMRYREMLAECVKRDWLPNEGDESRVVLSAVLQAIPTVRSRGGWVVLRRWQMRAQQPPPPAPVAVVDMERLTQALRLALEAFGCRVVGDERAEG